MKAAQVAPDDEFQRAPYLSRALHLTAGLPVAVLNLPFTEGISIANFNRALNKVVVVTDDGKIRVFELPSGKSLFVPEQVTRLGHRGPAPVFLPDDTVETYLVWQHPEPDPDETGRYALYARWNPVTRAVLATEDDGRISPDDLRWKVFGLAEKESDSSEPQPAQASEEADSVPGVASARAGSKLVSIDNDGVVCSWNNAKGSPFSTRQRVSSSGLAAASFVPGGVVGVPKSNTLAAWSLPSGKLLWSRPLVKTEFHESSPFRLAPDGASVLANWILYDIRTGQQRTAQKDIGEGRWDNLLSASVAAANGIVTAWNFYDGNRDELNFAGHPVECSAHTRINTPKSFDGLLSNGRYFLTRSNTTILLHDLCHPDPVASFHFGRTDSLDPYIARALLQKVVRVQLENQTVRLQLQYGPELTASRYPDATSRLRLPADGQAIAAPRDAQYGGLGPAALSADGSLLALAQNRVVRVWRSATGDPLIEPLPLYADPLDMGFSSDASSLQLAFPDGTVLVHTLGFRWSTKPGWLADSGVALTGRTTTPDGGTARVSPAELAAARTRFFAELNRSATSDLAARYLLTRFKSQF